MFWKRIELLDEKTYAARRCLLLRNYPSSCALKTMNAIEKMFQRQLRYQMNAKVQYNKDDIPKAHTRASVTVYINVQGGNGGKKVQKVPHAAQGVECPFRLRLPYTVPQTHFLRVIRAKDLLPFSFLFVFFFGRCLHGNIAIILISRFGQMLPRKNIFREQ